MSTRPHNLLPRETKRAIRIGYWMRVITVGSLIIAVAFALSTAALVPAYFLASEEIEELRIETAERLSDAPGREDAQREVDEIRSLLTLLEPDTSTTSATALVDTILAVRPSTIRFGNMVYSTQQQVLHIEGIATTRDDLVEFVALLEEQPNVTRVVLPISDLVRNNDLPFSVAIHTQK